MLCLGNGSANVHLSGVSGGGGGRLVCPDNLGAGGREDIATLLLPQTQMSATKAPQIIGKNSKPHNGTLRQMVIIGA